MHYIRLLLGLFALAIQASTSAAMRSQATPVARLDPSDLDNQQNGSFWLSLLCLCGGGFVALHYLADLVEMFHNLFLIYYRYALKAQRNEAVPGRGRRQRRIMIWYRDDRPRVARVRGTDPSAGFRRRRQPIRSQAKAGPVMKCRAH